MEHNEPLKFGHDPDGLSKRRISSILKAPRTSMKAFGGDQDEHQEESRPIEKRRNSRRVSFATTNDVHVFSKDIKTESPVLAPIQTLTAVGVGDLQDKKMVHFDNSENQPTPGLDTMLSMPFHISQLNKENFFPNPVLPDECVDKTMLLGEDTGYMDMTHSHTITIDKEVGINTEFSFNMLENVTGLHNLKNQNGMPSKPTGHVVKDAVHSEFSDFLASISKPGAQNIVTSSLKKNPDLFGLKDTTRVEMDKENVLPIRFTKQAAHCPVNPDPKGLRPRSSTASFLEQDHMDMTKSHTVIIDRRELAQHDLYSVHGNPRSTSLITQSFSNDMEITHSQTATINLKTMENINCSIPLNVDHSRSNFDSDTSEMVMTEVFDGFLQEQEQKVVKDKALTAFPKAHKISSFNQSENRHVSDHSRVDSFQNNLSFATMAGSDDMEITQSQTVVLETKCGGEPFDKSRKVPSLSTAEDSDRVEIALKPTGHTTLGGLVSTKRRESRRKVTSAEDTIFPSEQSAFMELTCQTNTSAMVMSPSPDAMELTECNYVAIDSENILAANEVMSRKGTSFMPPPSVSAKNKKVDCVLSDISVPHMADDMEMTQCQTVVLESKCVAHKPFGKSRKRLSLMPTSCDISSDISSKKDMKMAHELSGHTALNKYSSSELSDHMEIHEASACGIPAIQDDMELTGCRTITIDAKDTPLAGASNIMAQNTPCMLSSRFPVLDEVQMEMTEIVSEKPENLSSQRTNCKSPVAAMDVDAENLVDSHQNPYLADMDLVKSQAGLIYANSCEVSCLSNGKESSSLHLIVGNVESSEKDCEMEITEAFLMPFEQQCFVDFKQGNITKANAETVSGTTDQTTVKEGDHALPVNKKTMQSVISEDFATESELVVKKDESNPAKSRRKSLADLQEKLQNIAQSINEPNGLPIGSYTAPIVNFSEIYPVDEHSDRPSSSEPLNETPTLKNNVISVNTESTAPFNLKNFLTARLSLGGVTPKLPLRTKSASPNQTESISTNSFQSLHLEIQQDDNMQNSSYVVSMINNEVLPEEDLSDTVVSYLSNKKNVQDVITVAPLAEVVTEDDLNISQSEKMPCDIADVGDGKKEASEKLGGNNSAASGVQNALSLLTKIIDDSCSTSSSTSIKCEGISESTLRNSQFDSQIDGTMDHEFDFNKTLEDGSITVNEFLSHFAANTVIHRSRHSALPDNFRITQTHSVEDLLRERYIYRPKQRVYETDCQKLSEMAEGFKKQMADQHKPLRDINGTLLQDIGAFSNVQLQRFGSKLKERRVYFRKISKALSHEMKKVLYSELLKTTQDSKQSLEAKITETKEMLKDLDGCVNDLESELAAVNSMLMGDQHYLIGAEPALKAKQQDLEALNSEVTETKKQMCDQEHQRVALVDTQKKLQDEAKELESCITTLYSLNEWRFHERDENGVVFTFLHNTVHLEVKLKKVTEKEWMHDGAEQVVDISFKFLLNGESSEPHAGMIHKLLAEYVQAQTKWMQKYPTSLHIPALLHNVSLAVSRLRLLGEEIHQLKKWGGLRLGILHITCVDTLVEILFSSVTAFAKFELILAVSPDYPFSPLQMQKFQNHIGHTRADQIKDLLSSVTPAKNYLTEVVKRIHAHLMG
ncbi:kinetochore scaffold 1 [Colossoma macropomum]|uniref:kinetochore scaffold 1 n=1 Tax=Colossoma macropomum TaxID=42526 RepID=UPI001864A1D4|nr:kinetochore scaffold 1 [Colossoma macropomum]